MPQYAELFKGAARDYARYRLGYPKDFFDKITAYFSLDGSGHLLDLGCGTGQVSIPLSPYFKEVVGLDADAGMLAVAAEEAQKTEAKNIHWIQGMAENAFLEKGRFRLATIAGAFHWMDQDVVLGRLYEAIEPNGSLLIVSGSSSVWKNPENADWKNKVREVIQKYLGEERRAGNSLYAKPKEKFETAIIRSGFGAPEILALRYEYIWTIKAIIGLLYTTSFASRKFFGDRIAEFEKELTEKLLELNPSGIFTEIKNLEIIIAHK